MSVEIQYSKNKDMSQAKSVVVANKKTADKGAKHLFKVKKYDNFSYKIPKKKGTYYVRLRFHNKGYKEDEDTVSQSAWFGKTKVKVN